MYLYNSQSRNIGIKWLIICLLLIVTIIAYKNFPDAEIVEYAYPDIETENYDYPDPLILHLHLDKDSAFEPVLRNIEALCIGSFVCIGILAILLILSKASKGFSNRIPFAQLSKECLSLLPLSSHPIRIDYDKVKSFSLKRLLNLKPGYPFIRSILEVHWKDDGKEPTAVDITYLKTVSKRQLLRMLQKSLNNREYSAKLEESGNAPHIQLVEEDIAETTERTGNKKNIKLIGRIAVILSLSLIVGTCWFIFKTVPEIMEVSDPLTYSINLFHIPAIFWCILLLATILMPPLILIKYLIKIFFVHPLSLKKNYIYYSGFKIEYDDIERAEAIREKYNLFDVKTYITTNTLHLITKKDGKLMTDVDILSLSDVRKLADKINEILQQRKVTAQPE